MPTNPTPIDALPTAPQRTMAAAAFVPTADAFVAALATFRSQLNALGSTTYDNAVEAADAAERADAAAVIAAAAMLTTGYVSTGAGSLVVGAGSKSLTAQAGKAFAVNDDATLTARDDASKRLRGKVTAYDPATGALTVNVTETAGAGSATEWLVFHSAFDRLEPAAAADLWSMSSALVAMTPDTLADAAVFQGLTDAATIAINLNAGANFSVTLGGNRTLANPSNMAAGKGGIIKVAQDATGGRTLAFGSYWKRQGGAASLSTTAGASDYLVYYVVSATLVLYSIIRNPS